MNMILYQKHHKMRKLNITCFIHVQYTPVAGMHMHAGTQLVSYKIHFISKGISYITNKANKLKKRRHEFVYSSTNIEQGQKKF